MKKAKVPRMPKVICPKCGKKYTDFDGLPIMHCGKCGYCRHASVTNGRCDYCNKIMAVLDSQP